MNDLFKNFTSNFRSVVDSQAPGAAGKSGAEAMTERKPETNWNIDDNFNWPPQNNQQPSGGDWIDNFSKSLRSVAGPQAMGRDFARIIQEAARSAEQGSPKTSEDWLDLFMKGIQGAVGAPMSAGNDITRFNDAWRQMRNEPSMDRVSRGAENIPSFVGGAGGALGKYLVRGLTK